MSKKKHLKNFTPPAPSTASRRPPLRSRGSSRGAALNIKSNRTIYYESAIERRAAYVFMARPDVADILDQPPSVAYVSADGRTRSHTFDFLVRMKDGSAVAVAVKPAEKAGRLIDTLTRIAEQAALTFADRVALITERDLPPWLVWNAELIHSAVRAPANHDDDVIRNIMSDVAGSVKIADIVKVSGLSGRAVRAVARLICLGELILVKPSRIRLQSLVQKASQTAQAKGGR